jgi:hypothetical protein
MFFRQSFAEDSESFEDAGPEEELPPKLFFWKP